MVTYYICLFIINQFVFQKVFSHNYNNKHTEHSILISSLAKSENQQLISDESEAISFLSRFDQESSQKCQHLTLKEWNLGLDSSAVNQAEAGNATVEYRRFWKIKWKELKNFNWTYFKDESVKRQFKKLSILGKSALSNDQQEKRIVIDCVKRTIRKTRLVRMYQTCSLEQLYIPEHSWVIMEPNVMVTTQLTSQYNSISRKLVRIYSTAKICKPFDTKLCDLSIEPDITELMMKSRNEAELRSAWIQWRDVTGRKMRSDYEELTPLMKTIAESNGFGSYSSYETQNYEDPKFESTLENLWKQLSPFYLELHAYVRRKLGYIYGTDLVGPDAPIPSHLLGNMWAISWINIFDLVQPYNLSSDGNATPRMVSKGYTPTEMAKVSEDFFKSLGFPALPPEFWNGSVLEKIPGQEMTCHPSSWDLCDGKNFWIRQCTRINMENFVTLHHEMGHTMYQIQYKNLPRVFREGANAAFHEAIGDLIGLSVQTPEHLFKIGLLDKIESSAEADINFLLSMALEKVAFLPFGYLVDKWRWGVFDGHISPQNYNCDWWKLRLTFQGVSPPIPRNEDDFDPGAKYHIAANVGYIRYFLSTIIEFQFHEALCTLGLEFDLENPERPLHKCDLYGNKLAGAKLQNMLSLGSSRPWPEAMEIVTGQRNINASSLLLYFHPLFEWLKLDNRRNNVTLGWSAPSVERQFCHNNWSSKIICHKFTIAIIFLGFCSSYILYN